MKSVKFVFITAAMLFSFTSLSQAEGKIAVVDPQMAIVNSDIAQQRIKELLNDADYAENNKQFEEMQAEAKELIEKLQKDGAIMSAEQREEIKVKVEGKRSDLEHIAKKLKSSQQVLQQELLRTYSQQVRMIISDMIKTEGIGLLLNAQAAMHADSAFDITAKVTDKLNQMTVPAAAPAATATDG